MRINKKNIFAILIFLFFTGHIYPQQESPDWIRYVRLTGNGLGADNIQKIIKDAQDQGTLGIELDNDITGRYSSFLHPQKKLKEIKEAADAAHKIGNHAFIYIAGMECITANADKEKHSVFKDHPDWVQRDIDGKPAVFTGGVAFWVQHGDEDVWISPYATEWRKRYMEIVRQIAATGIDGIYIDVAYWMCSFKGWENKWASYDKYTVAAFKKQTGLDAKKDFVPGDFNNPAFLKWVDFRIQTMTDFFKEIYENVKSVNPKCLVIPEISPSIDGEVVRSGADAYEIKKYSDVITHEFYINTNTGAKRDTFDWLTYLIGVNTLKAFDENHPTWLLSYSWDHEKNTNPEDAMKLLSCTQLMQGANFWDAPGHSMAGSNDYALRKKIFSWIKTNENILYSKRKSINPVGVYFSPSTRNYFADTYTASFYGILHLLLNNHFEYKIVTPRTLKDFNGKMLVLPDVKILTDNETDTIERLYGNGTNIIITGATGYYNPERKTVKENKLLNYLENNKSKNSGYLFLPWGPGKNYFEKRDTSDITSFYDQIKNAFPDFSPKYKIKADYNVSIHQENIGDKDYLFITNLRGLKGYSSCIPAEEKDIEVSFESSIPHKIFYMPYLGKMQELKLVRSKDNAGQNSSIYRFKIPPVQFGGIVIIE